VWRLAVDVGGHHIRLDLVSVNAGGRAGVVDRVEDREQLARLVAVAEGGEGEHGPDRRMRVLATVLPDAGQVALDVAGIEVAVVERRREEQHQAVAAPDEVLVDCGHCPLPPRPVGGARQNAP